MESLPILISVGAFVFTIYQFLRNSNKEGTTQITTVLIKLENIADALAEYEASLPKEEKPWADVPSSAPAEEDQNTSTDETTTENAESKE